MLKYSRAFHRSEQCPEAPGKALPEMAETLSIRKFLTRGTAGFFLAALTACSGTGEESPTPIPSTPTPTLAPTPTLVPPSGYIYDAEPPAEPALGLNSLGPALIDAALKALQQEPSPIVTAYNRLDATGDPEGCPFRFYEFYGGGYNADYWAGECNASSGTRFDGYGYRLIYDDWDDGSGALFDGWTLYMSGRMTDVLGNYSQGAGVAADVVARGEGYNLLYRVLDGAFLVGGPDVETGWLDGTSFPSTVVYAVYYPSINGHYVYMSGGLGGLSGDVNTVAMTEVTLYDARLGSTCDKEPSGMISVRDNQGEWYDVLFDGPTEANPDVPRSVCDGCGQVWYRGKNLGQTCADFSPLLDWKDSPW